MTTSPKIQPRFSGKGNWALSLLYIEERSDVTGQIRDWSVEKERTPPLYAGGN